MHKNGGAPDNGGGPLTDHLFPPFLLPVALPLSLLLLLLLLTPLLLAAALVWCLARRKRRLREKFPDIIMSAETKAKAITTTPSSPPPEYDDPQQAVKMLAMCSRQIFSSRNNFGELPERGVPPQSSRVVVGARRDSAMSMDRVPANVITSRRPSLITPMATPEVVVPPPTKPLDLKQLTSLYKDVARRLKVYGGRYSRTSTIAFSVECPATDIRLGYPRNSAAHRIGDHYDDAREIKSFFLEELSINNQHDYVNQAHVFLSVLVIQELMKMADEYQQEATALLDAEQRRFLTDVAVEYEWARRQPTDFLRRNLATAKASKQPRDAQKREERYLYCLRVLYEPFLPCVRVVRDRRQTIGRPYRVYVAEDVERYERERAADPHGTSAQKPQRQNSGVPIVDD